MKHTHSNATSHWCVFSDSEDKDALMVMMMMTRMVVMVMTMACFCNQRDEGILESH